MDMDMHGCGYDGIAYISCGSFSSLFSVYCMLLGGVLLDGTIQLRTNS